MWTHRGILESATILSSTSVSVGDGLIFVPYSSGEIYAIRPLNGSVIWSDSLSRTGSSTSLSENHRICNGFSLRFTNAVSDKLFSKAIACRMSYQCGKPVVAPDLGGMAEKVHDGRTGLLFVNGDVDSLAGKMICLAQNRSLLASLAKGAAYHAIPRQRLINAHQRFYQRLLI